MKNLPMKLPRFTLRDVFWLVLVVAMGLGWWMQFRGMQSQLISLRRNARSQIVPPPLKADEEQRAIQLADHLLRAELRRKRIDNWGEPIAVRPRRCDDIVVEYATPHEEQERLGTRSVRVHRDNWTAAFVGRD